MDLRIIVNEIRLKTNRKCTDVRRRNIRRDLLHPKIPKGTLKHEDSSLSCELKLSGWLSGVEQTDRKTLSRAITFWPCLEVQK